MTELPLTSYPSVEHYPRASSMGGLRESYCCCAWGPDDRPHLLTTRGSAALPDEEKVVLVRLYRQAFADELAWLRRHALPHALGNSQSATIMHARACAAKPRSAHIALPALASADRCAPCAAGGVHICAHAYVHGREMSIRMSTRSRGQATTAEMDELTAFSCAIVQVSRQCRLIIGRIGSPYNVAPP